MSDQPKPYQERSYRKGLILVLISFIIFVLPEFMYVGDDSELGIFPINFLIAVYYFCYLWWTGKLKRGSGGLPQIFVFLVLFLISAYALNRALPIFDESAPWLSAMLVVTSFNYLLMAYFERMPSWLQAVSCVILGSSLLLYFYLAIYLFPIYPFSVIVLPGLGFSAHSFVPLLIFIFTIVQLQKIIRHNRSLGIAISGGMAVVLVAVMVFTFQWHAVNKQVNKTFQYSLINENNDLPGWIKVAQKLEPNLATEKYLKSDLVYATPSVFGDEGFWNIPSRNFDEVKKHDPLVTFAHLLTNIPNINTDDRIKMLESMYDARHKTQERLWSGENLKTAHVTSNVKIWPDLRIAYTEKTITVSNTEDKRNWNQEEEAIYTFHLPEGGVVTSLSLWINGKEEKGILTTKSKAATAYKTIVGVESRDPSVLHWQEGNTVSVRVFPVLAHESRIFKMGVTAPLKLSEEKLSYENIWFEGPNISKAKELTQVEWEREPASFKMPSSFEKISGKRYRKEGSYDPNWSFSFPASALTEKAFYFQGYSYSAKPYKQHRTSFNCDTVYLDLNASWREADFDNVWEVIKDKRVFAYDEEIVQVNEENRKEIFARLVKNRFSLFPLYEIAHPANALLITKTGAETPNIGDLKESDFAKKLAHKINKGEKIKLFNLGNELSAYLKSLKEHRVFLYEQGTAFDLKQLLKTNSFTANIEDSNRVVIDAAKIVLTRTQDSVKAEAPDHVMRLFAYNHIMQQLNRGLFTNQEANEAIVNEASAAYVVSPVSSLIVLESQADYDRFDIAKSKNSLENASLKSKGAVPEPHEWALIILVAGLLGWLLYKYKLRVF